MSYEAKRAYCFQDGLRRPSAKKVENNRKAAHVEQEADNKA
tara:strand:+ start:501 stop:623 length:123 start_codon:yes stop_codon:yes gene_type:complete